MILGNLNGRFQNYGLQCIRILIVRTPKIDAPNFRKQLNSNLIGETHEGYDLGYEFGSINGPIRGRCETTEIGRKDN